ncbi:MAG: purine-nucleoside phosphorylase [Alphaproteobacteria bacterium]|nr:purine-nucleoside phosphorylase [Alphaproteobacteria bacterium]
MSINTNQIKDLLGKISPKTAVVLGSGLGEVADIAEEKVVINYADIEGFPHTSVAGHSGQMVAGKIKNRDVLFLKGRFHLYEGHTPQTIAEVVRSLKRIGIEKLILTNAAGSLNRDFAPGEIMMIKDHINFSAQNPLIGANDENIGPRFPDMSNAYDYDLRQSFKRIAESLNIRLGEGVYLMVTGPNFETPAEIRMFQKWGADAVGMSTVLETISAVHCGIKTAAFSVITNFGAGMQDFKLTHSETLNLAKKASQTLSCLLKVYLEDENA